MNINAMRDRPAFDKYRGMEDALLVARIREKRKSLGSSLVILVHHYQKPEIVQFADYVGDSLELSRIAAQKKDASYIVFCGVNFMAECARILADPGQTVVLPDLEAGCPLADSARIDQVEEAWESLTGACPTKKIIPITYVNSDAELKAFTGRNDGSVCTSSNAGTVFDWAVGKASKVFFFPDEHLGRNTAREKGFSAEDMIVWDPDLEDGGNTPGSIQNAKVILWKGYCHVHTWFETEHVIRIRHEDPDAKIVAHPECPEEVIKLVDAAGSTGFIVKFVQDAPPGSRIAIATEIHLVRRLADENPDKTVYECSS
jgi:quinolinate synthase